MIDLVGKIGSMALINAERTGIDYSKFERIGRELVPSMVWVTSGATEIGRLDYIRRTGRELNGTSDEVKADYASQGQSLIMQAYRSCIKEEYSVRQLLVEHQHFNEEDKRKHIQSFLLRCSEQGAIPIVNYNDAVCFEENRKNEIKLLKSRVGNAVELVDNDETAAQIACLVRAKTLLILSSVDGIYRAPNDPATLIECISGRNAAELTKAIDEAMTHCLGASRPLANGARTKLDYVKKPALEGVRVIIANAAYSIGDILAGRVRRTEISLMNN